MSLRVLGILNTVYITLQHSVRPILVCSVESKKLRGKHNFTPLGHLITYGRAADDEKIKSVR